MHLLEIRIFQKVFSNCTELIFLQIRREGKTNRTTTFVAVVTIYIFFKVVSN